MNKTMTYFYSLPSIVMHAASFGLCLRLICCTIPLIPKSCVRQLRIRQLWHLSAADCGAAVFGVLHVVLTEHGILLEPFGVELHFCDVVGYFIRFPFFCFLNMSALVESSLALAIAYDRFRWILDRSLVWLWAVAALLAPLDAWLLWTTIDPSEKCIWQSRLDPLPQTPVVVCLATIALCTNVVSYVRLFLGRQDGRLVPGSMHARARRQLWRYAVAMFLTWVPWWLLFWSGGNDYVSLGWAENWRMMICGTAVASNGVANYYCYTVHNRMLRKIWNDEALNAARQRLESFHVLFDAHVDQISFFTESISLETVLASPRSLRGMSADSDDAY